MNLHQLLLHVRTARYMKPSQLVYFILRRNVRPRNLKLAAAPSLREIWHGESPCSVSGIYLNDSTFRFLNVEVDLADKLGTIDWSAHSQQRLWQYNLHYFDFLRESARPAENKDRLIRSWIKENPQGSKPGWEPFTTSLRIVNWIFYFRQRSPDDIPAEWLNSLYVQTLWLERNDERHILANHYFENLKALFFAGCFFEGKDATRWLERTLNEIPEQLREQTLADGGHYERSHQYHCLMLENYLDIYNLTQSYGKICRKEFVEQVKFFAVRCLEWLARSLFPDSKIPLFNDSAFGAAVSPGDIFDYAERLSIDVTYCTPETLELIDQSESGYFGCRVGNDMFIIDCGDIGPAYQPGHTHCDFLSYELMLANQRIVVDTGVCEYEPGRLRNYVRSTKAHNTVSVDGSDQSEIWGEFRVARRARRIDASISTSYNVVNFHGTYRGFYSIKNRIEHHRSVAISITDCGRNFQLLSIKDDLIGTGHHVVESFIHLHPDVTLECPQSGVITLYVRGSLVASIHVPVDHEYHIESCIYCPEFGKQIPNQVLVIKRAGALPLTLGYEIQRKLS